MNSLNGRAWFTLVDNDDLLEELNITLTHLPCGTRVYDAGIQTRGSLEAGLLMAAAGTADLAVIDIKLDGSYGLPWPTVQLTSNYPFQACYLSQAAHWPVRIGNFFAMGSGPACLLNPDLGLQQSYNFEENSEYAVLVLESRALPDDDVCKQLASTCQVPPDRLALIVAPTASLAGTVQIAARSVETGLHKLHQLGIDLRTIRQGMGICPIAPPGSDDLAALGTTNDMMLFASQVWLQAESLPESSLQEITEQVPSGTSPSYGKPFLEILKRAGDFYNIDPGLFAPAEITLVSANSARVYHAGRIDTARLYQVLNG